MTFKPVLVGMILNFCHLKNFYPRFTKEHQANYTGDEKIIVVPNRNQREKWNSEVENQDEEENFKSCDYAKDGYAVGLEFTAGF